MQSFAGAGDCLFCVQGLSVIILMVKKTEHYFFVN